jgi:hypothetical protein
MQRHARAEVDRSQEEACEELIAARLERGPAPTIVGRFVDTGRHVTPVSLYALLDNVAAGKIDIIVIATGIRLMAHTTAKLERILSQCEEKGVAILTPFGLLEPKGLRFKLLVNMMRLDFQRGLDRRPGADT